jgi:glutaredoxin
MFVIYGAQWCSYCKKVKDFLESRGENFTFIDIDSDVEACKFLLSEDFKTIPQVFKDDDHIGGYTETVTTLS